MAETATTQAATPQTAGATLSSDEWTQLCQVMNGYIYSQTLATACDLGLFTFLSANPGATRDELARTMGLTAHSTRVLMLAACASGLVCRDSEAGGYHNSKMAEKALVADSPYCMLPFVQFNHRIQQRCSSRLTRALQEGRNAGLDEFPGPGATLYERLAGYPELESLFQEAMGAYTGLSPKMLDLPELSEVRHLLDVGGGDGSNAIRLCRRFPRLRVTILETPSVSRIAREATARSELSGRIACVAGDMFVDPWPQDCDGVLFSHIVEIFSPEKIRCLYARAFSGLPPEGKMFVWTIMANDSETAGLQAAKSSIYFLCAASGEGMAYPGREHEQAIRETGFRTVRRYNAAETDHGALVAIK
jgi:hypothetical protein